MAKDTSHYIRRYRLRSGLTQGEMSELLGNRSGGTVYNYEAFLREPDLRAALAYRVITGVPVEELFGGIYQDVRQQVTKRAHQRLEQLGTAAGNPAAWYKRKVLTAIPRKNARELEPTI